MAKVKVAAAAQLRDGDTMRVDADGFAILLSRFEGRFHAIDAICSHRGGALEDGEVSGQCVTCPLHQAIFDLTTGKVSEDTPWASDQACFTVSLEGDDVYVALPTVASTGGATASGAVAAAGAARPTSFDYNPMLHEHLENPYPVYAKARRECPVFQSSAVPVWGVTRYDDIWTALKDPGRFSSSMASAPGGMQSPEVAKVMKDGYPEIPTLVTNDPPSHTRFRGLVNKAFTPRRVAEREPHVREIANELIDKFYDEGGCDLIWQFAYPLPMRLIAETLGVPREDMDKFKRWSDDSVARLSMIPPERQIECARSIVEFQKYFVAMAEERRREPQDDMLTDLVNARLEGVSPLTMPELLSVLQQLLVAGNETTTNLIGNMMMLVLQNPDQLQALRGDLSLAGNAVEEALRMEAPVQGLFRTTTVDAELGGVTIPQGSHLQLLYASGNRDESEYPDPDRFDVRRPNARTHLSFGGGIHFCIGAPLARLEARIALETLLRRLPNLRLKAGQSFERVPHFFLRGFEHLYLEWDPA